MPNQIQHPEHSFRSNQSKTLPLEMQHPSPDSDLSPLSSDEKETAGNDGESVASMASVADDDDDDDRKNDVSDSGSSSEDEVYLVPKRIMKDLDVCYENMKLASDLLAHISRKILMASRRGRRSLKSMEDPLDFDKALHTLRKFIEVVQRHKSEAAREASRGRRSLKSSKDTLDFDKALHSLWNTIEIVQRYKSEAEREASSKKGKGQKRKAVGQEPTS